MKVFCIGLLYFELSCSPFWGICADIPCKMSCTFWKLSLRRIVLLVFTLMMIILMKLSSNWLPHQNFKHYHSSKTMMFIKPNESSLNWSNDPCLSQNISKSLSPTSNVFSTAEVINAKASYKVNDTLQIRITARDVNNAIKTCGGDYFRLKLYTAETQSSWSIDVTNDLGNGTYMADVTLRWPGKVAVIVTLVHPSEALRVLQRIRDLEPGRMVFDGRYLKTLDSGVGISEDVMCRSKVFRNHSLCNFTDERSGYPWFCVAPSNKALSCDDWKEYVILEELSEKYVMDAVSKEELNIFEIHKLPFKHHPPPLNVVGDSNDWKKKVFAYQDSLSSCRPGQHLHNPSPSGFYIKNIWFSDQCKLRRFTKTDVLQCLKNRAVHIFGDSTARQLYSELANSYTPEIVGNSDYAKGAKFNISVHFRFHGFPVRKSAVFRKESVLYIPNELDNLKVDSRTVILITVGTHYTTWPLKTYEERMRDIKAAVQRLHRRSPQTLVVFKSANTRNFQKILHQLQNSEWYIWTLDLALKAILKDSPELAFIDAWDMTIAQNCGDDLHPCYAVISNLMNNFLSYICPDAPSPLLSHI